MTNDRQTVRHELHRGLTLVELLVVGVIVAILLAVLLHAVGIVRESSNQTACAGRLRQLSQGFAQYRGEYRTFPTAVPPTGFGDRSNWRDLWSHIDPMGFVFSETVGADGIAEGDRTRFPRVPRLLESYTGEVTVLHCNSQGAGSDWNNLGPYWYHATSPFPLGSSPYPAWIPYADLKRDYAREPLAACQSPLVVKHGAATWRHGKKKQGAGGKNNHAFPGGNVKTYDNPQTWRLP